jgi:intracellular multiplication protein IcmD
LKDFIDFLINEKSLIMREDIMKLMNVLKKLSKVALGFGLMFMMGSVFAQSNATDIAGLVSNVQKNALVPTLDAVVSISYLAGAGFIVASIFKFKAHKDNPTQVPIGTPITLLLVGIGLLFFPAIVKIMMTSLGFSASGGGSLSFSDATITGSAGS